MNACRCVSCVMAVGHDGSCPFGLALASVRRGFHATVTVPPGMLWRGRVPSVCESSREYFGHVYDHLMRIHGTLDTLMAPRLIASACGVLFLRFRRAEWL